jgi:6-phosphogluconolactonase/glucosamine-6-phosphate isomerase/deaminase
VKQASSADSIAVEVLEGGALAVRAAGLIASTLNQAIRDRGTAVFVPSAGRTATPAYKILRGIYRQAVDWQRVHIVQMDEYTGLGATDPLSFAYYLTRELVAPLGPGHFTHFNNGCGGLMHPLDCYESAFGGIDLVVHGIGRNGHIGFNEPGSPVDSDCRQVILAYSTLCANFLGDKERRRFRGGLTLGLKQLRAARSSLLLATGTEKAEAMEHACRAPASIQCPASILRTCANVTVLADPDAASLLEAAKQAWSPLEPAHA